MIYESKKESKKTFRRPFGCSVLHLDVEKIFQKSETPEEQEYILDIFSPFQENNFYLLHESKKKN